MSLKTARKRSCECWEASCASAFGCRFFDRLEGTSMPGRCAGSSKDDVVTPKKKTQHRTIKHEDGKSSAVRKGTQTLSATSEISL